MLQTQSPVMCAADSPGHTQKGLYCWDPDLLISSLRFMLGLAETALFNALASHQYHPTSNIHSIAHSRATFIRSRIYPLSMYQVPTPTRQGILPMPTSPQGLESKNKTDENLAYATHSKAGVSATRETILKNQSPTRQLVGDALL